MSWNMMTNMIINKYDYQSYDGTLQMTNDPQQLWDPVRLSCISPTKLTSGGEEAPSWFR